MNEKHNKLKLFIEIALIVLFIVTFLKLMSIEHKLDNIQNDMYSQKYQLDDIEQALINIEEANKLISKVDYNIIEDQKKGKIKAKVSMVFNEIKSDTIAQLAYRITYDCNKPLDNDYTDEEWIIYPIEMTNNSGYVEIPINYSMNYEMKVILDNKGNMQSEYLPVLDIYNKFDAAMMRDINIQSTKGNKVRYDVQISKRETNIKTELSSAMAIIRYKGEEIKRVDILEENLKEGRQKPKAQLENFDSEYLFLVDEVKIADDNGFEPDKFSIELIIEDSIGNNYRLSRSAT